MANLILPSRFTQQPQYPVEIDWNNSFSRNLILAIAGTPYDHVRGILLSGTVGQSAGKSGRNTSFNGTSDYLNTGITLSSGPLSGVVIANQRTTASAGNRWIYAGNFDAGPNFNNSTHFSLCDGAATASLISAGVERTYGFTYRGGYETAAIYADGISRATGTPSGLTAGTIFIGAQSAAAGFCAVNIPYLALFKRVLTNLDHAELNNNPWQIFRKRPQILYFDVGGGGATDLTIADATHGHSADNAVLTSSHLLTVADATHAHSADNVALSTAILLALADALHGHTADNLTLTLAGSEDLVIADASHAHTADSLSLTTLSVLVVAEALHSHLADNVVLSLAGTENLVIADAAHAHSADNLSLTSQLALTIAEATHAHTADGIVITSQHVLAVADALHAHLSDNLTLSDAPSLTIAEATHGHAADNLALTSDSLLAIADAAHAHLADEIELTSAHTLAIIEAMHAHLADNVTLSLITLRAVELLIAATRDTTLTAAARDTTLEARYEFHG